MTPKKLQQHSVRGFVRVAAAAIAVAAGGCEAPPPARPAPPPPTIGLGFEDESAATTPHEPEQGDAWLAVETMLGGTAPAPAASGAASLASSPPQDLQPYHALVLQTFQGDLDGQAASVWRTQLGLLVPPLEPHLGVHTDRKGAIVIYGHYDGWDDPAVAEDLASLRNLRVNDKRIFGPIIRTTIQPQRKPENIHPHELLSLRLRYPKARTIYTLEIEIWGDFDSGMLSAAARRSHAETRVAELRAAGTPAFFHHDPISQLSTVTVGAFDEMALDAASGLPSTEVERWQRKFPHRLTNGEQLSLPIQGRSDLGAVPQRSRLVLVPEL